MTDLVLIPSYFRPEFLSLVLEHLEKARGGSDKEVWVAQDMKTNDQSVNRNLLPEVREVARRFEKRFLKLRYIQRHPHSFVGNNYNFLELYKEAFLKSEARYVYLVEDDVIVNRDFFQWHEAVQKRADYFCTVGWHCIRNNEVKPTHNPLEYIESTRDYSSIGVCWKRGNLGKIAQHAKTDYYGNHPRYLADAFPGNPIPPGQWTEQAGLIMRLLLQNKNLTVAWAGLRRCSHIGLSGYHRRFGHKFTGDLDQRIEQLKAALHNGSIKNLLKNTDDDVEVPEYIPEWNSSELTVTQIFSCNGAIGAGQV